jgi:DNA mismatch repair ATPase MutS
MVKDLYMEHLKVLNAQIASFKRKSPIFMTLELILFAALLFFVYEYFFSGNNLMILIASAICLFAYLFVRHLDGVAETLKQSTERLRVEVENELKFLDGDFSPFDDGSRYVNSKHAFSVDMDIFGKGSLFNRVNRTVTTGGSDMLAYFFSEFLNTAEDVDLRKRSIHELVQKSDSREAFIASAIKKIDTGKTESLLNKASELKISSFFSSSLSLFAVISIIVILLLLILLSVLTSLSANIPITLSLLILFFSLGTSARSLNRISQIVNSLSKDFSSYSAMLSALESAKFEEKLNKNIHSRLFSDEVNSRAAFKELSKILSNIDRRGNILGMVFANALFCSDFFLVRRFIKWQKEYLIHLPSWIECISKIDAMMSMATFSFNHEDAVNAEIIDTDKIFYEATALYHPFIGNKAVKNDFKIDDGVFYIITGANMAGKSTFLRSVGINYVLAMNGMPVFAQSLKVSMFHIFTSMCTTDDLTHGISYFNAELIRLQQLISACKKSDHTLIILDEILKGTNSLDKLNGSRLFLESISSLPVSGVIATHDLELSKMADSDPQHFHNYCFEVELGDDVTYSYRISPGVARNQNATFLLNNILKSMK